jgi:hypothetical protein
MVLVNNISARKKMRREVGGPAQRLKVAVEQLTGEHSTPTVDFFRAISAGGCLVVSTAALCGAKPNSLTPLGSVSGAAVVENYYVAHLACACLMQCSPVVQAPARLARE